MAGRSTSKLTQKSSQRSGFLIPKTLLKSPKFSFALALLFADAVVTALIVAYVPYTKIDWDAYMSQVSGFLGGERDYTNLKGDTGPLVYPAGFLYVYSAVQYVTGGEVYPAQILFGILYLINLGIILCIYVRTDVSPLKPEAGLPFCSLRNEVKSLWIKHTLTIFLGFVASQISHTLAMVPWWALALFTLSKRVHSIFVLRLFNDCFAMTFLHAAMALLLYQKWHLGLIVFSVAVSIKMNVLLYAPPLLVLMLKAMDIEGVITALMGAALLQILLGLPFLTSQPTAYISRAFNLGRVFIHFWSVNFKFVPEQVFTSKEFAISLLIAHLLLLVVFAHFKWCKHEGGLFGLLHSKIVATKQRFAFSSSFPLNNSSLSSSAKVLEREHILATMFMGNFIGIVCARSLHYQFYSWYFHSLPYLLWKSPFPTSLRLILFIGIEICWNIYPSNVYSSAVLLCLHLIILGGLWCAPCEHPYADNRLRSKGKDN